MNQTEQFVKYLTWEDYVVLTTMLGLSAGIGIFFGCFGNKMNNTKDYLLGGKSVGILPVSASLGVSFISAILLLGGPSEVYQYGVLYWLSIFAQFLSVPFVALIFIPVFWEFQLTSVYEYLEHRFNKGIRTLGSAVFIVQIIFYMAMATYAPCLALAQMTPLSVYTSVSVMLVVCMFYTALGGIKAVIWTDVVQNVTMYACLLFVYVKGTSETGGIEYVWHKSVEGGRANLVNWDPNPTTRHTFWTLVVGFMFYYVNINGVSQTQVQRYLCLSKKSSAIKALILGVTMSTAAVALCCYGGLVIYARYGDCDPVRTGRISKHDQLFPLFAMDILGKYPGLPGLLIAGIFSAALSTVSSGINSLTASALEDYVKKKYPEITDTKATVISKGLSIGFGLITFGLIILVERLGNMLEATITLFGMLSGPHLGLFTLGMVFPWTNSIGAAVGTLSGMAMTFWVGFGYRAAVANGQIKPKQQEFSIAGCTFTNNSETQLNIANDTFAYEIIHNSREEEEEDVLSIYYISYQWYVCLGFFTTIVVGLMASFVTGATKYEDLDERVFTPVIRKLLAKRRKAIMEKENLGNVTTKL